MFENYAAALSAAFYTAVPTPSDPALLLDSGIAASHCSTAVGNKPSFGASNGAESFAEPSAPSPDTSDASFDDLNRMTDAAASSDGVSASTTSKQVHARLAKLIKKHEKELRRPKTMLTDKTAMSKIFDLEALKPFNDLRLTYSEKIQKARTAAVMAAPRMKPLMRRRIPKLQPAISASEKVVEACGKGPSFARRLRKLAVFLAETREVPESRQGRVHSMHPCSTILTFSMRSVFGLVGPLMWKTVSPKHLYELLVSLCPPVSFHRNPSPQFKLCQCNEYDGDEMASTPPKNLPPGQKVHHCIYHDECCFHANDQSNFVWMNDGEQPLRAKGRGRVVHVSDFIIEDTASGCLALTADQILAQLELPLAPTQSDPSPALSATDSPAVDPPVPVSDVSEALTTPPVVSGREPKELSKKSKEPKPKKVPKPKNVRSASATGRTADDHNWILPPAPNGISYGLPNFDAGEIIYPGAKHEPWWDMPQLIKQVLFFIG
ncbi:hypothetical protein K438DRAFT_1994657 [Mycena galopus ATCC 62051]|nr:hypothetical protein K438DRAFT_1994657 [Mycena galopus ATCC 62051]